MTSRRFRELKLGPTLRLNNPWPHLYPHLQHPTPTNHIPTLSYSYPIEIRPKRLTAAETTHLLRPKRPTQKLAETTQGRNDPVSLQPVICKQNHMAVNVEEPAVKSKLKDRVLLDKFTALSDAPEAERTQKTGELLKLLLARQASHSEARKLMTFYFYRLPLCPLHINLE